MTKSKFQKGPVGVLPLHESYKELGMGGESTVTPGSQRVAIPTSSQPLLLTQGAR